MKSFIIEKYEKGNQSRGNYKKRISEPQKLQLTYFLQRLREKEYGPCRIFTTEIRKWCEAKQVVPDDPGEPFILDHYVFASATTPSTT